MRYHTRFQAKKQQAKQQQAQAKQEQAKPLVPQEELQHIRALIMQGETLSNKKSMILNAAELFEYIAAHPTILSYPRFYETTMQKIREFETDSMVSACRTLLSSMEALK